MMKITNQPLLSLPGILLLTLFVSQGCYTQLAVSKKVSAEDPAVSEGITAESQDDLQPGDYPPYLKYYNSYYRLGSPMGTWQRYGPLYYDPGFHFSFRYSLGNYAWDPWYYRNYYRYYNWDPYYYGSLWWDPFYWDPFYWDPFWSPGYTYGYYPGSNWGYGPSFYYGSGSGYIAVTSPAQKRDWERRGSLAADRTVERPGSGSEGSTGITGPVRLANSGAYDDGSELGPPLSEKPENQESTSPSLEKPYGTESSRTEIRDSKPTPDQDKGSSGNVKKPSRILRLFSIKSNRGNTEHESRDRSRSSVRKKSSSSSSVSRPSSGSSVKSHSKPSSSSSKSSGSKRSSKSGKKG